jgi:sphingolipid 4-desaturase/C4-monooxygenase
MSQEASILLSPPQSFKNVFENTAFRSDLDFFHKMYHDEPHSIRRRKILEAHPEVKELFGNDLLSFPILILVAFFQLLCAYMLYQRSWWEYLFCIYFIGAILTHTLQVLVHDFTHFTCFKSIPLNKLAAIFCNVPTGIPSAISFGRYHKDHHNYLNVPGYDPDLPTVLEIGIFNTPLRKLIFLIFIPFFYALRPLFVCPKKPNFYEILNIIVVFGFDYVFVRFFGWSFLLFLVLSSLVGMGFHPVGMHVIAEHYEFFKSQETYSYYGLINIPNLNLGYHIEHHDFPMIPWTRLRKLKKIAPEFYDNLPYHSSYIAVAYKYICDINIGPWSRIARMGSTKGE